MKKDIRAARPNRAALLTATAAAFAIMASIPGAAPVWADGVSVVVDGSPVEFAQPPVEQAGRVFVPLRGVFERLGASVVYQAGLINATGGGHDISLHIGSTEATVDGRSLTVDSAPFVTGETTLVPLRFISQALGASVRYDDLSDTVYITRAVPPRPIQLPPPTPRPRPLPPPAPRPPAPSRLELAERSPASATNSSHPAVSAAFSEPVDPNTVRIQLDGRDVESGAYVSTTRFQFETPTLPPGPHSVRVFGRNAQGAGFDKSWTFTSGNDSVPNALTELSPRDGETVGRDFMVSGRTLPGARVKVAAATSEQAFGGIFRVGIGTFERTVTADGGGYFSISVHIDAVPGGNADVFVQSTAPSGAAATKRLSLRT
jgi:hypothetical protein